MTYSVAPHLNPTPAEAIDKTKKVEHAPQQAKSVELAGSGVTSVFPSRLETNVGSKRGPNWLAGFLYWLRRKEKGRSRVAGVNRHHVQVNCIILAVSLSCPLGSCTEWTMQIMFCIECEAKHMLQCTELALATNTLL